MSSNTRRAKNPLTREELVVRDVINETVDTARLEVLRGLNEFSNPVTQTDLIKQADVSRQTASNHLAVLRDRGFVNSHERGIELTAGGKMLLDSIETSLGTISAERLSYMTRSDHPATLLRELEESKFRLTELQTKIEGSPSRPTVRRILGEFDEFGWTEDLSGQRQLTATGTRALSAYTELGIAVEQLIEKAAWLQRLPPKHATVPLPELADTELIISDPTRPSLALWTALKLYDHKTSKFRALCSIYNPILYHAYRGLLELGIDTEVIFDLPSYLEARENRQTQFVVSETAYRSHQPLVLDQAHTLGIGIYDTRKVAVAAYNEYGSGKHIAMIVSSNRQMVDWGIDLYNSYRVLARPPSAVESK
ncbi:ArsR family transcriptional regulator [Natrononativus amylolyticus]|uniref:transcriptional regulator FilR1 domain-containing protein n=1 Tax=Natrononativus amylolyticus TaxID=2963434 RepID=UPI0020CE0FA9|nr:ArsR family transcriptional regulator [Natrononativus amylolyticus]